MSENPPYLASPGTAAKSLEKIKAAATPERFNYDFVSTVLGFKGGTGRALVPFYKRLGFVKTDGSPSELYSQFRNPATSKRAAASALKIGYAALYERNEYVHVATDEELRGIVVETTGLESESAVVKLIVGTFKSWKAFCDFDAKAAGGVDLQTDDLPEEPAKEEIDAPPRKANGVGLNLAYSINLHLPASDDIKVFDAIFKSLKEHLLRE